MKYLISTTEIYRADNEAEAVQLIEDAKQDNHFILSKYSSLFKERKQKGEVVDSWYKLTLVKAWDDEKDPSGSTTVTYGTISAFGDEE